MPGVVQIPMPNEYRCDFGCGGACNLACARHARSLIEGATSGQPAALMTEFLFSSAGVIVPPKQWCEAIRNLCDDFGMVLIADEAQTGLGRTGEWFAFEHQSVVPDLIVISKTLGGGVPLSAVVVRDSLATEVERKGFKYTSSHSGDPLLAAAGMATIDILVKHNLLENVRQMGAYLKSGLDHLRDEFEIVGDARGLGLKLGLELVTDKASKRPSARATQELTTRCLAKGLILGNNPVASHNTIRILPGFGITREQVDKGVGILEQALAETVRVLEQEGEIPAQSGQTVSVPVSGR
jgi:4-aminobutyrate aminotransferase-like enzyme